MRVRFYVSINDSCEVTAKAFVDGLQKVLCQIGTVEIADNFVDVIHVFGAWNKGLSQVIDKSRQQRIPIVYSPLGGLSPWNFKRYDAKQNVQLRILQKKATLQADLIQTFGPQEQLSINRRLWGKDNFVTIKNPLTTHSISFMEVSNIFYNEYTKLIEKQDLNIKEEIKKTISSCNSQDTAINQLTEHLLYLEYWNHRETLPNAELNRFANSLNTLEYDENMFPDFLKEQNLLTFFRRIEQILMDMGKLTEGFMPITALDDQTTERMRHYIF